MSAAPAVIGTQIDGVLQDASRKRDIWHENIRTVAELLHALGDDKQVPMLRTTAGHVAECLQVAVENLTIDALVGLAPRFTTFLEGRRHKRNAIRSYRNYLGVLLRKATELGWKPQHPETPMAWEPILAAIAPLKGGRGIVSYAINMGKTPACFTDEDMNSWAQMMLVQKRDYQYVRTLQYRFRRLVSQAGLAKTMPGIFRDWKLVSHYFVPLEKFPPAMRQEVETLLKWKQAPYVLGRKPRAKLRPISARNLQSAITRVYGFLVNVLPKQPSAIEVDVGSITSLPQMVTADTIGAFLDWWLNVRQRKGRSVVVKLGALCAALKQHPAYQDIDFSWFEDMIRAVPFEPESRRRERKERKYLPYDVVADIPRRIHQLRESAAKLGSKELACVVQDELLIKWLTILPWRQRNIRECRLGTKSEGANLFKAEIEQWDSVKKPKWVEDRLRENPHEKFWQYHFREDETKTGNEIRSILPQRLVAPLEEYVDQHRTKLVNGSDPGTLFLNRDGAKITDERMGALVSNLTLRHAGRRVTPHIFRDIWAYWWLALHPEDYLTVSKKLWHRNIQTTLRIYGCKFDESQADCRVEDWLESVGQAS